MWFYIRVYVVDSYNIYVFVVDEFDNCFFNCEGMFYLIYWFMMNKLNESIFGKIILEFENLFWKDSIKYFYDV